MPLRSALVSFVWHPWHAALAATLVCAVVYLLARAQLERAREDWANAYFYSPSQKTKRRQRKQRWQDRVRALLVLAVVAAIATALFYWLGPR
jgi:Ca2+/Na+ antiporter